MWTQVVSLTVILWRTEETLYQYRLCREGAAGGSQLFWSRVTSFISCMFTRRCAVRAQSWNAANMIRFEPDVEMRLTVGNVISAPTIPCDMRELGNKWTAWHAGHERATVHLMRTRKEMIKMFCEGVTTRSLLEVSMYIAANDYTYRCLCCLCCLCCSLRSVQVYNQPVTWSHKASNST
jgi:hypothetical protein